jgi:putative FmdB family regulatory protein
MPIYEYYCPKCKIEFELRLSFNEFDHPELCPKCHTTAQRLISTFSTRNAGNMEIAEKPFRKHMLSELESQKANILITPPPAQAKLLPSPVKKSTPVRRKKR